MSEPVETAVRRILRSLKRFAWIDLRAARVVELRGFGGFREKKVAEVPGVPERAVREDWRVTAMRLSREIGDV